MIDIKTNSKIFSLILAFLLSGAYVYIFKNALVTDLSGYFLSLFAPTSLFAIILTLISYYRSNNFLYSLVLNIVIFASFVLIWFLAFSAVGIIQPPSLNATIPLK